MLESENFFKLNDHKVDNSMFQYSLNLLINTLVTRIMVGSLEILLLILFKPTFLGIVGGMFKRHKFSVL